MMPGYLLNLDYKNSCSYILLIMIADLCIFGNAAYPATRHAQGPYIQRGKPHPGTTFNTSMSRVRVVVEWPFGGIRIYFAIVYFKKNLKLQYLQAVGKLYVVSTIL